MFVERTRCDKGGRSCEACGGVVVTRGVEYYVSCLGELVEILEDGKALHRAPLLALSLVWFPHQTLVSGFAVFQYIGLAGRRFRALFFIHLFV